MNEDRIRAYASALWKVEVEMGNCVGDWPLTASLERSLLSAASAACGVMYGIRSGQNASALAKLVETGGIDKDLALNHLGLH